MEPSSKRSATIGTSCAGATFQLAGGGLPSTSVANVAEEVTCCLRHHVSAAIGLILPHGYGIGTPCCMLQSRQPKFEREEIYLSGN